MKGLVLIQGWVLMPLSSYCKMFNQVDRWLVFTNAAAGIFLRIKVPDTGRVTAGVFF